MKQEILNWLKYDRTFLAGMNLLSRYSKARGLMASLNRQGESEYNNQLLRENLGSLIGLTVQDVKAICDQPVKKYQQEKPQETPVVVVDEPQFKTKEELIANIPEIAKKAIRLRDEFPFLKEKDCPNELKVLVSDMLSAYDAMKKAHESLFTAETEEELLQAAKETVENYLENRAIWDELNHYKENKQILGAHPLFEEINTFKALASSTAAELAKKKGNVRSQITRLKKAIESKKDPEKLGEYTESLAKNERLLTEIQRLLASR